MANKQEKNLRILSLQSHVTRDYVGNRAAVLPLQLLGYDVDVINTVAFSSMYVHDGSIVSGSALKTTLMGLFKAFYDSQSGGFPGGGTVQIADIMKTTEKDVTVESAASYFGLDYTHILTGYIGDITFLSTVADLVRGLKAHPTHQGEGLSRAKLPKWFCDPVLGDRGKLYVAAEFVEFYRNHVLALTDFISPNQYEAQWLSGIDIKNRKDAIKCCEALHRAGPNVVIITSVSYEDDPDNLHLIFSELSSRMNGNAAENTLHCVPYSIRFKKKNVYLGGTGDLMAAMLAVKLAHHNLETSCKKALSIVQAVIDHTISLKEVPPSIDIIGARHYINMDFEDTYTAEQIVG